MVAEGRVGRGDALLVRVHELKHPLDHEGREAVHDRPAPAREALDLVGGTWEHGDERLEDGVRPRPEPDGAGLGVVPGELFGARAREPEPVVVEVALDGPRMEDSSAPMAAYFDGREDIRAAELLRVLVHDVESRGSASTSPVVNGLMRLVASLCRRLGVRGFDPVFDWDLDSEANDSRRAASRPPRRAPSLSQ